MKARSGEASIDVQFDVVHGPMPRTRGDSSCQDEAFLGMPQLLKD
jgi:hypothetical protein